MAPTQAAKEVASSFLTVNLERPHFGKSNLELKANKPSGYTQARSSLGRNPIFDTIRSHVQ